MSSKEIRLPKIDTDKVKKLKEEVDPELKEILENSKLIKLIQKFGLSDQHIKLELTIEDPKLSSASGEKLTDSDDPSPTVTCLCVYQGTVQYCPCPTA